MTSTLTNSNHSTSIHQTPDTKQTLIMNNNDGSNHSHHHHQQHPPNPAASPSSGAEDSSEYVIKLRDNDVLLGRGGGTNNHAGNVKFRRLVNEHKLRYLAASKVDKPKVAREVVQLWRQMDPPGRFLARTDEDKKASERNSDENTIWFDVGDKKANAKASQCLRERTPEVMPYLRQLREQQDLSTEQGVMMVRQQQQQAAQQQHQQQQQQQHQQQGSGGGGGAYGQGPPGAVPSDPYAYPPMAPPSMGGVPPYPPVPVSPHHMQQQHGAPSHMSPHAVAPGRHPGISPAGGGHHMYPTMGPSPTQDPYSHHSPRGAPRAGYYSQGQSPIMAPPLTGSSGHGGQPPPSDSMDPTVAAYYGDMTDLEYEQSMMIMQQQLEMQQMQLRRMQQQRAMQQQLLQSQRGSGGSSSSSGQAPIPLLPHNTRVPNQPPAKMTGPPTTQPNNNNNTNNSNGTMVMMDAAARKPKRTLSMTLSQ